MWHQLPAYSPLTARAILGSLVGRAIRPSREIQHARALVMRSFAADDVLFLDSGRSALQLAIDIAMRAQGSSRIVALPAFQCFEVASAAVGANCGIMLYDIDPNTLGPDFESLEQALRNGAGVVVLAPLYGMPIDWEAAATIADRYGATLIEDAAQCIGSEWRNRRLGSLGALSVLSFGRGKGWTGGGGGAICVRAGSARSAPGGSVSAPGASTKELRRMALATLQWLFGRPTLYTIPASIGMLGLGETHYHAPEAPRDLAPFSAALLSRTFDLAMHEAEARRSSAARWKRELPSEALLGAPHAVAGSAPGFIRFPLRLRRGTVDQQLTPEARRAGVAPSYPSSLNGLSEVAARMVGTNRAFPGAECLSRTLFTLPTHSRVAVRDRLSITHWISRIASL